MIKRYICLFFALFLFTYVFSDNASTGSCGFPIDKYKYGNGNFRIDNIMSLAVTYWIQENPFPNLDYSKSYIVFTREFIFLSDSKFLVIETMWTASYLETLNEYIFDHSISGLLGVYSYELNKEGNIENKVYVIKLKNNKLFVYDKITEKETVYVCRGKAFF
ncbi:hypothetical protein [Treponema pedis]|uniref:Lipoprotein n=4 Tax=Treponema pedis TaxID=409322 RepID=S6A2G9_9SPIR|nr:hypothetical protein [Treponema pedis]AGT42626.1 hypothetical protein TPE_0130 [Treponema pedis str. T A4]